MAGDRPPVQTARDELATYIRDRHLDHPVVIGHSLGAFLAMWLASSSPDLVGPVIVVDGAASLGGDVSGARAFRDQVLAWSDAEWVQQTREMFAPMFGDKTKAEPTIAAVLRSDRRTFANAFYELLSTDIRADLPKITAPVLALLSDSPRIAQMIKSQVEAIPQHDTHVLAKTRHFVMFDDPPAFFAAVDAFLAAHPQAHRPLQNHPPLMWHDL
jgi:pimeloyl-ACP methyl ester carboxylesterase